MSCSPHAGQSEARQLGGLIVHASSNMSESIGEFHRRQISFLAWQHRIDEISPGCCFVCKNNKKIPFFSAPGSRHAERPNCKITVHREAAIPALRKINKPQFRH
jgi:hypothetical protein